jgi:hypothetical protein
MGSGQPRPSQGGRTKRRNQYTKQTISTSALRLPAIFVVLFVVKKYRTNLR